MWIIIKKGQCDIVGQLHTQVYKVSKKQNVKLQLNEKKPTVKGKPDKINELILKMKANLKEAPDNI